VINTRLISESVLTNIENKDFETIFFT